MTIDEQTIFKGDRMSGSLSVAQRLDKHTTIEPLSDVAARGQADICPFPTCVSWKRLIAALVAKRS